MKKAFLCLFVIIYPAAAVAGVVISCAQVDDTNQIEVSYTFSDDANRPRAFGLDISLDNGMLIGVIVSGSESEDYWVYPGTIYIDNGFIIDDGTPMVPNTAPGACGGPGESCMTVEMGSLYNDPCDPAHLDPPTSPGVLFRFTIYGSCDCNVMISANSARGGVVLENGEQASTNLPTYCLIGGCYTGPDVWQWFSVGMPVSWCNPRQCHGDADGLLHTEKGKTNYWVGLPDLQALSTGWKQDYSGSPNTDGPDADALPDTWIAADFDHIAHTEKGYTYNFRVGLPDLQRLSTYWKGPNDGKPEPPTDCLTNNPVSP